jgi:two-component system OmpR family sensor kinase
MRQWLVPTTPRGRLLTGILALVALGLAGTDLTAYAMLGSFLDGRADSQTTEGAATIGRSLSEETLNRLAVTELGVSVVALLGLAALALAVNLAFDERQRAEERLRRFLADASHELRTPLTTIRGWADLYFQGGLPDRGGLDIAMTRIADDAGQVTRLVEELLLLARLDEERPLEADLVDLAGLAVEVVAAARMVDPTHPITAPSTVDSEVVVRGDPDRLRQVLRNLVGNAIQHTPAGTAVRVELVRRGGRVTLTVADAGPGISAADRNLVFERFYRTGTGTGLGLAITKAIVEAHDGTIRLDSANGTGTEVEVTLPAA